MLNTVQELSVDPEGVTDLPSNSIFVLPASLFAFLGCFAIIEPSLWPVCLGAIAFGLLVLFFAKSWNLAKLSIILASACVIVGGFAGAAGISQRWLTVADREKRAIAVALEYMAALSRGDRNLAIRMVGLPQMVMDDEREGTLSREQQAVRVFLTDKPIQDVIKRGADANWVADRIISSQYSMEIIEIRVRFYDRSLTNPAPYIVTVKMVTPNKYSVDTKTRWLVSDLQQG